MSMSVGRRDFLRAGMTAGALAVTPRWFHTRDGPTAGRMPGAPPIADPSVRELALRAVEAARAAGASYADVRLTHTREKQFPLLERGETAMLGAGVRALVDGYWGFAASTLWTPDEVVRLGREAVHLAKVNALGKQRLVELGQIPVVKDGHWAHLVERDPFDVPEGEIRDFLRSLVVWADRKANRNVDYIGAIFGREEKAFASSEGSYCTQRLYRTRGGFGVTAGNGQESLGLSTPLLTGASRGWEYVRQEEALREEIHRLHEEIQADLALPGKPVEVGRYDVVFDAASMATLLAEMLGCATDLARALAYRAHEIGTSYLNAPLTMLGSHQAGAPLLTVLADRAMPGGLATVKWDDEGVEPDQFPLVKKGVLVDFQTHREGAGWLKEAYAKAGRPVRSHGCAAIPHALGAPAIAMPNLTLLPGAEALDFDGLVGGMKHGLAVKELTLRMDWQCLNGSGGGGATRVYEVKDGKRVARIRGAEFLLRAPEFWQGLQALGGPASQRPFANGSTVLAVPAVVKQVTTIKAGGNT